MPALEALRFRGAHSERGLERSPAAGAAQCDQGAARNFGGTSIFMGHRDHFISSFWTSKSGDGFSGIHQQVATFEGEIQRSRSNMKNLKMGIQNLENLKNMSLDGKQLEVATGC